MKPVLILAQVFYFNLFLHQVNIYKVK